MWLKGLLAAFIQSAATSVTLIVVDPSHFANNWHMLLSAALVSGVVGAALYLKQSPIPKGCE